MLWSWAVLITRKISCNLRSNRDIARRHCPASDSGLPFIFVSFTFGIKWHISTKADKKCLIVITFGSGGWLQITLCYDLKTKRYDTHTILTSRKTKDFLLDLQFKNNTWYCIYLKVIHLVESMKKSLVSIFAW